MSTDIVRHALPAMSDREVARLKSDAIMLARTNLIPSALRNKPDDVLAIVAWGAAIGLEPSVSVQSIYLIEGRPYPSGRALVAAAKARGHRVDCTESTSESCTVVGLRRGDPIEFLCRVTYTLSDAKAAGLVGKDVWRKFGSDMLYWRAARRVVDRVCPEVVLGLGDVGFAVDELDDDPPAATYAVTATVDQPAAIEAAVVPQWSDSWRARCKDLGCDAATSKALIHYATQGLTVLSTDVPEGMRGDCDVLLGKWAQDRPADVHAWLDEPEAE